MSRISPAHHAHGPETTMGTPAPNKVMPMLTQTCNHPLGCIITPVVYVVWESDCPFGTGGSV